MRGWQQKEECKVPTGRHVGYIASNSFLGNDKDLDLVRILKEVNHALEVLILRNGDEGLFVAGEKILDGHGIHTTLKGLGELMLEILQESVLIQVQSIGFPTRVVQRTILFVGSKLSSGLANRYNSLCEHRH